MFAKATLDPFKNTAKIDPILRQIEPKPARIRPDSTLQHQIDARSMPEAPKIDFGNIFQFVAQQDAREAFGGRWRWMGPSFMISLGSILKQCFRELGIACLQSMIPNAT